MDEAAVLPPGMASADVTRYSRQMLVPDIGGAGQARISQAKVLVVGAGGLGCSVIPSLAGAGVSTLGVVDPDIVDLSNLHRQLLHRDADASLSTSKVDSAARAVAALNPQVEVVTHCCALDATNALELVLKYDVIADCSDNPLTRYLLSDACVLAGKPLVSGSAVGLEGQLTVYNHAQGPCYRCVYPQPTASGSASCSDVGVVGPVPAVIGHLQALEVLKLVGDFGEVLNRTLVMYDARTCTFHRFKLPARRPACATCGSSPSITSMGASAADITARGLRGPSSCSANSASQPTSSNKIHNPAASNTALDATCATKEEATPSSDRSMIGGSSGAGDNGVANACSAAAYAQVRLNKIEHVLLDVRDKAQFSMCSLPGALNIPMVELKGRVAELNEAANQGKLPIYVICRRGIASRSATDLLLSTEAANGGKVTNVEGGLLQWNATVDSQFPAY